MIKHPLSFLGGALMGALAMYYMDSASGGRRRAQMRDQMAAGAHDAAERAQRRARQAMDRAREMMGRGETQQAPDAGQPQGGGESSTGQASPGGTAWH